MLTDVGSAARSMVHAAVICPFGQSLHLSLSQGEERERERRLESWACIIYKREKMFAKEMHCISEENEEEAEQFSNKCLNIKM